MRATDGEEPGPLLDEQLAYYRALAADYLDQGLDLPGGDDLAGLQRYLTRWVPNTTSRTA